MLDGAYDDVFDHDFAQSCPLLIFDVAQAYAKDGKEAQNSASKRFGAGPCSYHEHGSVTECPAP